MFWFTRKRRAGGDINRFHRLRSCRMDAATGTNGAIFRLDNVVFCAVSMFAHLPRIGLVVLFLSAAAGHAEPPSRVDLEAADMTAELIGAPVFAKDGVEVGAVADIALDEGLQPFSSGATTKIDSESCSFHSSSHRRGLAGNARGSAVLPAGRHVGYCTARTGCGAASVDS
jgi:hypothetical protein